MQARLYFAGRRRSLLKSGAAGRELVGLADSRKVRCLRILQLRLLEPVLFRVYVFELRI